MGKTARLYDHNSRSLQEVAVIDGEIEVSVNKWLNKFKGCGSDSIAKEATLKLLLLEVGHEKETMEVVSRVVKQGHLLLELDVILRQTRWLKAQKIFLGGFLVSNEQTAQR